MSGNVTFAYILTSQKNVMARL